MKQKIFFVTAMFVFLLNLAVCQENAPTSMDELMFLQEAQAPAGPEDMALVGDEGEDAIQQMIGGDAMSRLSAIPDIAGGAMMAAGAAGGGALDPITWLMKSKFYKWIIRVLDKIKGKFKAWQKYMQDLFGKAANWICSNKILKVMAMDPMMICDLLNQTDPALDKVTEFLSGANRILDCDPVYMEVLWSKAFGGDLYVWDSQQQKIVKKPVSDPARAAQIWESLNIFNTIGQARHELGRAAVKSSFIKKRSCTEGANRMIAVNEAALLYAKLAQLSADQAANIDGVGAAKSAEELRDRMRQTTIESGSIAGYKQLGEMFVP